LGKVAGPAGRHKAFFSRDSPLPAGLRTVTSHALADGRLLWKRDFPEPFDRHHAQDSWATALRRSTASPASRLLALDAVP
jgi:hypothetical protein